jgi:transcriptional antiterminator
MKGIRSWLNSKDVTLTSIPGVGVMLECPPEQHHVLVEELASTDSIQLVLSPQQRQQLISFLLLIKTEPVLLTHIALILKVSRSTVLSDLEQIENWFDEWEISIERKQNYGLSLTALKNNDSRCCWL